MSDNLTYDEAAALLDEYGETMSDRDERIIKAWRAHLSKTEIAKRMGIDRGVAIRVIAAYEASRDTEKEAGE